MMDFWRGVFFLVVVLVATVVCADEEVKGWSSHNFPNPTKDLERCGRQGKISYICDPSRILRLNQANQLDNMIMQIINTTECPCASDLCDKKQEGYRISIALVESIIPQKRFSSSGEMDDLDARLEEAEKFAYSTLHRWGFGRCKEDIIIFYSKEDHVIYTMTGEAADKKLPAGMIGEIAINTRTHFDDGNYFEGLKEIIHNYHLALINKYDYQPMNPPRVAALTSSSTTITSSPLLLICLVAWLKS